MKQKISNRKEAGKVKKQEIPAAVKTVVETVETAPEAIRNIELSMIACNPFNPRRYRTEGDLEELAKSIANFGIIQPVTLRRKDEQYEIVCGERRCRASLKAERTTIPAIIKDYSDEQAMEICILENLQRRDINPVEEAVSFGKLMEIRGYSIDDLVKQFGRTDKYIRSRLQLRNLAEEIAELPAGEEITLGIALEPARFRPDIQQDVYREHLCDKSWSSRNTCRQGSSVKCSKAGTAPTCPAMNLTKPAVRSASLIHPSTTCLPTEKAETARIWNACATSRANTWRWKRRGS